MEISKLRSEKEKLANVCGLLRNQINRLENINKEIESYDYNDIDIDNKNDVNSDSYQNNKNNLINKNSGNFTFNNNLNFDEKNSPIVGNNKLEEFSHETSSLQKPKIEIFRENPENSQSKKLNKKIVLSPRVNALNETMSKSNLLSTKIILNNKQAEDEVENFTKMNNIKEELLQRLSFESLKIQSEKSDIKEDKSPCYYLKNKLLKRSKPKKY